MAAPTRPISEHASRFERRPSTRTMSPGGDDRPGRSGLQGSRSVSRDDASLGRAPFSLVPMWLLEATQAELGRRTAVLGVVGPR